MSIDQNIMENQPHTLVIGAGAAGIAATTRLIANGFENIVVLEAENRIGGRLHSVNFDGAVVDLGAQWVHGQKNNTVYRLVKDLNLLQETTSSTNYDRFTFFTSDKSIVDQQLLNRLILIAVEILEDEEQCETAQESSMKDYFLNRYYKKILTEFPNDDNQQQIIQYARILEEWIHKFVLCYDAAESWSLITPKPKFVKCEGNQLLHWQRNGYETFLDVLMKNYPKQPSTNKKIFLNKKVNTIIWNDNKTHPGKVTVQCSDNSTYQVDHVISTVSIAVLKDFKQSVFTPKLPKEKSDSIDEVPLGNVMKIFLKFPEKWWPDDIKDFSFLWCENDKEKLIEKFSQGSSSISGRSWLAEIFGFYTIESDPNILLCWCVGPMVKEIELLPDDIVQQGCMFLLRKFLGDKFTIPEIQSIRKSNWGTNPNFQGTFSYTSTIMGGSDNARFNLIEPLLSGDDDKPVVLFAGEATHPKYFSTVHGAVDSGYREADRLIELYQKYEHHKIVIIGAGMAGLAAATRLVKSNIEDFVVLESQATAGGRVHTIDLDSKALDLGAQWIHGRDNPLYELAKQHNLLADEQSEEGLGLYIRSNGEIVDHFIVNKAAFVIGQILEECSQFVDSPEYPVSLEHFLCQRFNEFVMNSTENHGIYQELYDWHERFQIVDNSCRSLSRLSAKSWGEYICLDDIAHFNLKNGYQSLVDVILNQLPRHKLKYQCELVDIRYRNENIELVLKNDRIIRCDHLVLTPSLGVIKSTETIMQILPMETQKCVDYMGFAGICKVFLIYDDKWWKNTQGLQLLWSNDCNFPEKNISWLRQISGFEEVFNHPNVLMAWIGGGDSVEQVENLEPEEIGKQCTNLIQKFLPNWDIPLPNKVIRTKWLTNPHIKGSYCHITPECDNTNYGIRKLTEPIRIDNVPRILLAGEAVHPSHYSTAHGAYESGMQQADVLIDYIKCNE